MRIEGKRVFDEPGPGGGFRVLVDRLWPRGVSKERAAIDLWAKDAAPSTELRKTFHSGMPWEDFAAAYERELAESTALTELRLELAEHDVVTLIYSVSDAERNHALILREALIEGSGA